LGKTAIMVIAKKIELLNKDLNNWRDTSIGADY